MLARSSVRLWTPQYFRGHGKSGYQAVRHTGPRRTRIVPRDQPPSFVAGVNAQAGQSAKLKSPYPHAKVSHQKQQQELRQASAASPIPRTSTAVASPLSLTQLHPLVSTAKDLLARLSRSSSLSFASPQSSTTAEAMRSYVEFTARRDVFGPLHRLLPDTPAHRWPAAATRPAASPLSLKASGVVPRLRVVLPTSAGDAMPPTTEKVVPTSFNLEELVVFLQLYDAVGSDDGQLLLHLMTEVHRQLLMYATAHRRAAETQKAAMHDGRDGRNTSATDMMSSPSLPLPALLFTMSSLGLVEEAVLDLVTSALPTSESMPVRRGLLYRELPHYSTAELITLTIALHRFGHSQQPSMKATTKALRVSLYNKSVAAGAFHRIMKDIKKRLDRSAGAATHYSAGTDAPEQQLPATVASDNDGSGASDTNGVRMLQTQVELPSLVLQMQCPLFLLLEALTAASLTIYRRADVVSFLSDLIATTAVIELSHTLPSGSDDTHCAPRAAAARTQASETQEYVVFVAHQLLRAAKLTEEMELPQPLLLGVFAWCCTLTGKGVVVDGGEAGAVPSDRVAFYDHVTADLIKVNRSD